MRMVFAIGGWKENKVLCVEEFLCLAYASLEFFFIKDENMYGHVKAFQVLQESICQWV